MSSIFYVLYGIPIPMGVASVIIALLDPAQAINMILPLGLGMTCLGISRLDLLDKE